MGEDRRGLGEPKLSQTQAPPTLPAPAPASGTTCGEGAGTGGDLARPAETSVPLQLDGARGQAPPQRASGRAAGAPWALGVCRRLPGAHPRPSCPVLSPPGHSGATSSVTREEELRPGTPTPVLVIIRKPSLSLSVLKPENPLGWLVSRSSLTCSPATLVSPQVHLRDQGRSRPRRPETKAESRTVCGRRLLDKGAFLQRSEAGTQGRDPGHRPKIVSRRLRPIEDSQGAARGSSVGAREPGGTVLSALGTRSRPGCQGGGGSRSVCSGVFLRVSWVDASHPRQPSQ